jgi:hypothetical protein
MPGSARSNPTYFGTTHLLSTKPDDSPVSLDAPLARRERGMKVRDEQCNVVT